MRSEQGFGASGEIFFRNDARPAESIQKPAAVRLPQGRAFRAPNLKINKRMDNNDDDANKSGENLKASEILYTRRNNRKGKANDENEAKGREIQETAESASFVKERSTYNGYEYPTPEKTNGYEYPSPEKSNGFQYLPPQQGYSYQSPSRSGETLKSNPKPEKLKSNAFLSEPQPFITRPTVKPTEMYVSTVVALDVSTTRKAAAAAVGKSLDTSTTEKPESKSTASTSTVTRRGSTTYQSSLKASEEKESVVSRIQTVNSAVNDDVKTTTPSYDAQKVNTYSTARKSNGKTKETPFYTPTIPTIRETVSTTTTTTTTSPPITTTSAPPPESSTKATNSEIVKHALEMMESLKELEMGSEIPSEPERYSGQRAGFEVPPSSGPNALNALALYFANGDGNNTKRMIDLQNARFINQGISSVFLSDKTVTKYEQLFPGEQGSTEPAVFKFSDTTQSSERLSDDDYNNDLETQHSKNPVLSAAGTPQLREIAQIFTHALSAYLQDPEQFRKILSEIRPTQPPPIELNEIPRFAGENEFVRQESAYNVPRGISTATTTKPEDLEIFDFSDVTAPTKDSKEGDTTTEGFEENTTTESNIISTTYYPQVTETLPPASSKLADKTPASRLLTEKLEKSASANARTAKELDQSLRLPADEINGALRSSSRFNFDIINSKENDDTNYFPQDTGRKANLNPYGFGVKPENSTPINDPYPTSLSDTQAIPLRWGEELTTVDPTAADAYPTVYSELLPPYDINGTEIFSLPNNDIQQPNEENDESLQRAQSQSFVSSRNNIYTEIKKSRTYNDYLNYNEEFLLGTTNFGEKIQTTTEIPQTSTIRGHFVTKSIPITTTSAPETTTDYSTTTSYAESIKTTLPDSGTFNANSKTTVSYAVFLDPLTINDGLMDSDEDSTVTPSPHTYLPNNGSSTEEVEELSSTQTTTQRRGKSSFATTPLTIRFAGEETNSIEPMQKRANEMFGNLNETQVNHLMNVMKKAEENKTVKRLILLLIQTCDGDDHNKTLEESRTALLNALIGMDNSPNNENRSEIKIINTRREKSLRTTTTTTEIPITTYKSVNHEKYTSSESVSRELEDSEPTTSTIDQTTAFASRGNFVEESTTQVFTTEAEIPTTEVPSTSTTSTTTTTTTTEQPITLPTNTRTRSIESKPKFRLKSNSLTNLKVSSGSIRHQKSLGTRDEFVAEPSQNSSVEHKHADARALELLRSLYSLASRWGK